MINDNVMSSSESTCARHDVDSGNDAGCSIRRNLPDARQPISSYISRSVQVLENIDVIAEASYGGRCPWTLGPKNGRHDISISCDFQHSRITGVGNVNDTAIVDGKATQVR